MSAEPSDQASTVAPQPSDATQPTGATQTIAPTPPSVEQVAGQTAQQPETPAANQVPDETGEYDARFLLWRQFCDANGVSVDLLPSELDGEMREKWDTAKDEVLHQPAENSATPTQTTKS